MLAPRPVLIRVLAILFSSLIVAGATPTSGRAQGWLLPGQALPAEPLTVETAPDPQRPAWIINPIGKELLRPSNRSPRALDLRGAVVVSGFSGVTTRTPRLAADRPVVPLAHPHYDWIDPDGASAVILDVDRIGRGIDASEIDPLPRDRLLARDIGQVFGVAIVDEDPEDRIGPALFLNATSAYGLPLIGPDENGDRLPDRVDLGSRGMRWMPGLWGTGIGAGPGTVWRVDPQTSAEAFTGAMVLEDRFDGARPTDVTISEANGWGCIRPDGSGTSCSNGALRLAPGQEARFGMRLTLPGTESGGTFKNCARVGISDSRYHRASIIQSALQSMGIDGGPVDGSPGRKTREGVQELQMRLNLEATGEIDYGLFAALGIPLASVQPEACAVVDLPPIPRPKDPDCQKGSTFVPGKGCVKDRVRDDKPKDCPKGTTRNSRGVCIDAPKDCPRGSVLNSKGD